MASLKFGVDFYDTIFNSSQDFQNYVNTTIADLYNREDWKKWFPKNPNPAESNTITVNEIVKQAAPTPDVRARYSEFSQTDKDGFATYLTSIPDLGHGIDRLTLQDKERYMKLSKVLNNNQMAIEQYTEKVVDHIKAAMGALTYMSHQLLTSGAISYSFGQGLSYTQSVPVPSANKYKALTAVWTSSSAKPLEDMHNAESDFKTRTNYRGEMYWRFDKTTARYFCENPDVVSKVGAYVMSASGLITARPGVTIEQFNKWAETTNGWISKIEVVEDSFLVNQTMSGKTYANSGWVAGQAVLTPVGYDGTVEWLLPSEFTIKAGLPNYTIATLEGGMIGLENKYQDSMVPEWNTNYIMSAVPVMRRWNEHVILDTLSV